MRKIGCSIRGEDWYWNLPKPTIPEGTNPDCPSLRVYSVPSEILGPYWWSFHPLPKDNIFYIGGWKSPTCVRLTDGRHIIRDPYNERYFLIPITDDIKDVYTADYPWLIIKYRDDYTQSWGWWSPSYTYRDLILGKIDNGTLTHSGKLTTLLRIVTVDWYIKEVSPYKFTAVYCGGLDLDTVALIPIQELATKEPTRPFYYKISPWKIYEYDDPTEDVTYYMKSTYDTLGVFGTTYTNEAHGLIYSIKQQKFFRCPYVNEGSHAWSVRFGSDTIDLTGACYDRAENIMIYVFSTMHLTKPNYDLLIYVNPSDLPVIVEVPGEFTADDGFIHTIYLNKWDQYKHIYPAPPGDFSKATIEDVSPLEGVTFSEVDISTLTSYVYVPNIARLCKVRRLS